MSIKQLFQNIYILNYFYTRWKWRKKKVSYGKENVDKTFFVIRRATCNVGLFSYVMTNMGLVKYAVDRGYIPIIDMKSMRNTYLEPEQVQKINAWELYFEQPGRYTLEDIKKSKNVILSNGIISKTLDYPDISIVWDKMKLEKWQHIFGKYFCIKESLLEEYKREKEKLWKDERVLGVLARGTDYVSLRPTGHPIQPTVNQIIDKVQEVMADMCCEYIFLATEDKMIHQQMKEQYGDRLRAVDITRYTTEGKQNINDFHTDRNNDRYLKGKEYLFSIWLLTQCNGLVAGNVGGTHGALLMGTQYEYSYVFDLGTYA